MCSQCSYYNLTAHLRGAAYPTSTLDTISKQWNFIDPRKHVFLISFDAVLGACRPYLIIVPFLYSLHQQMIVNRGQTVDWISVHFGLGRDPTQLNGLRVSLSKQEHSWQGEKAINKDNFNKRRVENPILCAHLLKSYSIYQCTKGEVLQ